MTSPSEMAHAFDLRPRPCPTCKIEATRVLGMRGGQHHRYKMGIETPIVQCERCTLVFPNPFPYATTPAELYGDPEKFFPHNEEATVNANVERFRGHVREAIERCKRPAAEVRVVDVGSGRGEFIAACQAEGVKEVIGLELADGMIEHARRKFGAEVRKLLLEEFAEQTNEEFDIVLMSAVLEHMYDPDAAIAAASKIMRKGGMIYLDIPCEPSLLTIVGNGVNKLLRKPAVFNLAPTWPPYHVFGFNPKALRILLEKHGFELVDYKVWADPHIPSSRDFLDRVKATVATQINRLANVLKLSANMSGWAVRR